MIAALHAFPFFQLHVLRPHWLWALLALPPAFFLWRKKRQRANAWRDTVDAHLLPHLLADEGKAWRGGFLAVAMAWALAVLALAGPSWRQSEQPLWQSKQPLVVALDLSSASNANDLPPSRLLQARAKLATLFAKRGGGEVALVAFAGDAFTVAPLTDDANNLALFLDALDPSVMPVDGQNAARAIALSARLLKQAGFAHGDILLLADHADADAAQAASDAAAKGYRVSALGLGTASGAAYQASDGSIQRAQLSATSLRALAFGGGGSYEALSAGDGDLRALGVLDPQQGVQQQAARQQAQGDDGKRVAWQDDGYWLLLPLALLAAFAFRRGVLAVALVALSLPLAQQAHAQTLWLRADQQQQKRIEQGVRAYNRGDYKTTEKYLRGLDLPDAQYDLANALAKQGRYEEALAAYDSALKQQPQMQDATANREVVLKLMQQKGSGGKNRQQGGGSSSQQSKGQGGSDPSQQQQARKSNDPAQRQGKPDNTKSDNAKNDDASPQQPQSGKPQDANRQQNAPAQPQDQQSADAAQREKMQQAMKQQQQQKQAQQQGGKPAQAAEETEAQRERRQAADAWLRRVPDDPGGLLRSKFRLEYERRQREGQ